MVGVGAGSPFSALMLDVLPNRHSLDTCEIFPRFYMPSSSTSPGGGLFELSSENLMNHSVTDWALEKFQRAYGLDVSKDDIFFYVYGILHSPQYLESFAFDLKKMLPRIPLVRGFREFADAGRSLSDLHLGYETVDPYPLSIKIAENASLRVEKMKYASRGREVDKSTIVFNPGILISGIPEEAHQYFVGPRTALDWVIDRYQVKTDKASGIINDPNDWAKEQGDPRYILELLGRIVTVSVETVKIVRALPPLDIIE